MYLIRHTIIITIIVLSIINGLNTPTWSYLDSSIETTSSSKIYISEKVYETLSIKTYTLNEDYYLEVQKGSAIKSVLIDFPTIDSFVVYDDTYYICPSGINQPHLFKYTFDDNSLTDLSVQSDIEVKHSEWAIQCIYRKVAQENIISNVILIPFNKTGYFFYYSHFIQRWCNKIHYLNGMILKIEIDEKVMLNHKKRFNLV